jgi:pyruvate dehydrogenase phosphatase
MMRERTALEKAEVGRKAASTNMALRLLREALGGDDCFSVSRVLTLDMDVAWIDDTAIIVQDL